MLYLARFQVYDQGKRVRDTIHQIPSESPEQVQNMLREYLLEEYEDHCMAFFAIQEFTALVSDKIGESKQVMDLDKPLIRLLSWQEYEEQQRKKKVNARHVDILLSDEEYALLKKYTEEGNHATRNAYIRERLSLFREIFEGSNVSKKTYYVIDGPRKVGFTGQELYNRGYRVFHPTLVDVVLNEEMYAFYQEMAQAFGYEEVSECASAFVRFALTIEPFLQGTDVTLEVFTEEHGKSLKIMRIA